MIGGMVSSTLLTLIVIPSIYAVVKGIGVRNRKPKPKRSLAAILEEERR
jgi:Cu(I)/Ag(I) efflux system membrane protein CusA/SilA